MFPSFHKLGSFASFPRFSSGASKIIDLAKRCSGSDIKWFKHLWNPAIGTKIAREHPDTVAILKTHSATYCAIRLKGSDPLPPSFVPVFAIPLDAEIVATPSRQETTTGEALLSN